MNVLTVTSFYALFKCLRRWSLALFLTSSHRAIDKFWIFQGTFTAILFFIFIARFVSHYFIDLVLLPLMLFSFQMTIVLIDSIDRWFDVLFKKISVRVSESQRIESSWTVCKHNFIVCPLTFHARIHTPT